MRRLSIIDVAGGHQPLTNEDGTLWLVANGEIYNYRALRSELAAQGHRFRTASDCETILHLYEQHGDAFVERSERHVRLRAVGRAAPALAARPRSARASSRSTCATTAGAWSSPARPRRSSRCRAMQRRARSGGAVVVPRSWGTCRRRSRSSAAYASCRRRRVLSVGARQGRGAPLLARARRRSIACRPRTNGSARVRARLEESVRMQMVSDVPIGAFLSGGIDSSAVVAFMAAHSDRPVKTYAIGFGGGEAEDYLQRAAVRAPGGAALRHRPSRDPRPARRRRRCCRSCCGTWTSRLPTPRSSRPIWSREFARRDVTVILSGVGGDELFGGYRRYLGSHYQAYFDRLPARIAPRGARRWARSCRATAIRRCSTRCVSPRASSRPPACRSRSAIGRTCEVFPRRCRDGAAAPRRADERDALADAFARGDEQRRAEPDARRSTRETQLPDDLLLLTDKMSMAVSLECRVPLLDHELVELAARMPAGRQDPRRAAEARAEGGARRTCCRRTSWSARSAASARRWAPGSRASSRRCCATLLSEASVEARGLFRPPAVARADRGARGQPAGRHRPAAGAAQPRDLGAHLPRRARAGRRGRRAQGGRGVKILYVCHRFPFPPKRGGKIRPFNMIRHLSRAARGSRRVARALAGRGAGRRRAWRRYCARYDIGAGQQSGPGAADGRCACRRRCPRRWDTSIRRSSRAASTRCSPANASTSSSCTARRSRSTSRTSATRPRSSTSATWTRRSGSSTRATSRSRFRSATGSKASSSSARKSGLRVASTSARRRRAPNGRRSRATARASPTDWFPNGVDSDYFAPADEPYDADTIAFVGRMDYYPNQECMFDFCATDAAAAAGAAPGAQAR